jgi:hypothetical protein
MEYLDFNRKNSASVSMPESYILLGEIFFLDIIFDFIENNFKSKKYAVYKAIYIKNLLNFKSLNKNNYNFYMLIILIIF